MRLNVKANFKWILGAVVVATFVALAAAPWTVSQTAQIGTIEREVRTSANMRLASHGRSVFVALPRPHIRIYDANLDYRNGAATISTSSLRVDLDLLSLFTGRFNLARVLFADAVITVDPSRYQLETLVGAATQKLVTPPEEVEITNGKALLRRENGEEPEAVAENCDARLDFSRAGAPVSLIGHCILPLLGRDEPPVRFAVWAAKPNNLPHGEESPITLRADSDSFQLNLNGGFGLAPKPHFHGQIAGVSPSLLQVANWFGLTLPLPGRYRNVSIKGDATIEPGLLSFSPLAVTVNSDSLDGAASIRLDGQRPQIAATLAGSDVNLGPMFEDIPTPSSGGQWSRDSFAPSHLASADLDLRLSATHARLGDFQADNAAVSAILKNGRLDLSLAGASAYSGQMRARAIVAESADGLDVRGSAVAEKIDVAALLWDVFRRQSMSGIARASVSFETGGNSFYDFASRLDARGDFTVEAGEIYGLDLGLAFRHIERQPLTAGIELKSGRTPFNQLSAKFNVVQGQAEIEEGLARDERTTVYFSGRAQVAERALDLHAVATRAIAGAADAKPLQIGFSLSGGWDDAILTPDALGFIERSDAAAPLLPKAQPQN